MNNKKFYAQVNHSSKATTTGAIDIYTFLVLEFKNNKIYPSDLVIPFQKQSIKKPVNYRFENKILYLAKPLDFKEDLGTVFTYTNGNLVPKKKRNEPEFVFKPSLDSYFKRNK
ncbi:hypothetical protein ACMGDK_01890 [Chryseobacterium sp. DT-3]|uniref:hypothetical protein n=1 Tax=Chryseobacterium sp. DT-3 TaxID=3396164 RepID=UPI003F1A582E